MSRHTSAPPQVLEQAGIALWQPQAGVPRPLEAIRDLCSGAEKDISQLLNRQSWKGSRHGKISPPSLRRVASPKFRLKKRLKRHIPARRALFKKAKNCHHRGTIDDCTQGPSHGRRCYGW